MSTVHKLLHLSYFPHNECVLYQFTEKCNVCASTMLHHQLLIELSLGFISDR